MSSIILDGKAKATSLLEEARALVLELSPKYGSPPKLAIVMVGSDAASLIYVRNKLKAAAFVGIETKLIQLDLSCSHESLSSIIALLNADPAVHGIILQSPLPAHLPFEEIAQSISVAKDVDGFNVVNAGQLARGTLQGFVPCTPLGCLDLILSAKVELLGTHVVVVGRSNIVGRPLANLLLTCGATVTICHRSTDNLEREMRNGRVVVTATGTREAFNKSYFARGAVLIDVGISKINGKIRGDVDFEDVRGHVSYITPVPGGVGPMTVAYLMLNTLKSFCIASKNDAYRRLFRLF